MSNEMRNEKRDYKIGDGVTVSCYTDQEAFTVIKVTKNSITIQRDKVIRLTKPEYVTGGFAGHCTNQREIEYLCEPDPKGWIRKAFWSKKKQGFYSKGHHVYEGKYEFYDFNF